MPCRSLAHLSMAHSPLEWKRLKADVWRCDMFETWWWCLLHCKAYDFLSLHIFLCKFSIDMVVWYMWWIYENMVCLILITAIFLYRKQTLIIINRLGYRQSLGEPFMTSMIKLFFSVLASYIIEVDEEHVRNSKHVTYFYSYEYETRENGVRCRSFLHESCCAMKLVLHIMSP